MLFSEVLGEHYHASNNFIEVPLLYEPKKYQRYLSGICHINSFNENVIHAFAVKRLLTYLDNFLLIGVLRFSSSYFPCTDDTQCIPLYENKDITLL
jgi:hypothetical protein